MQAKLMVGAGDDRCELEADRVAAEVVRRLRHGNGDRGVRTSGLARKAEVGRSIRGPILPFEGGEVDPSTEGRIRAAQGRPLQEQVRARFEGAFDADLSPVRVHTGADADELSRSMGAVAFTVGRDIFFSRGAYRPDSPFGQELLAHELTHTIQQGASPAVQHQTVTRHLQAKSQGPTPVVSAPAAVLVQRWQEYTTEFAEKLADHDKIKLYRDRIEHMIQRHGPNVTETSPKFYTFLTDDTKTIRWYVRTALKKGACFKSPGNAFDFEYSFPKDIGKNVDGDTTNRIRAVVVELGETGDLGKVQTAYPIP